MSISEILPHSGGFISSLASGKRSLENVVLTNGSGADMTLTAGTVLGIVTASGKYAPFDEDASDGTEDAAGILLNDMSVEGGALADGADRNVAIVARDAEVNASELQWGTADAGEQAAALLQLNALGIIERAAV